MREERITLAHGAGGKATHTLIDAVFVEAFRNPVLEQLEDGASLEVGGARLAFTTDSYVVSPLFFPGGDIGDLAVNGTVNDLAMCGARPLHLSAGFILEEGFPVADLRRIADSMARAAAAAGVQIVTGDTKVVPRGKADGCFITTAGVGVLERPVTLERHGGPPGRRGDRVRPARRPRHHDHAGPRRARHRGRPRPRTPPPLHELTADLLDAGGDGVRVLRDATRGGVATILNEIAAASQVAVVVDEASVPVREVVTGASELLGIDPLYVACEGRLVAVVDAERADGGDGRPAGRTRSATAPPSIGHVADDPPGLVLLRTAFGGTRIVDMLVGDPAAAHLLTIRRTARMEAPT